MKKVIFGVLAFVGIAVLSNIVYAACTGPYCWDDTRPYIQGRSNTASMSSTTINGLTPALGDFVQCNSCANAVSGGNTAGWTMCHATSTVVGSRSWVIFGSTNNAVVCQ